MANLSESIQRTGKEVIAILKRDRFFPFASQPEWLQDKASSAAQMWLQHLSIKLQPLAHLQQQPGQQRRLWHNAQCVFNSHVNDLQDLHNTVLIEYNNRNELYLLQALSAAARWAGGQIDSLISSTKYSEIAEA